MSWDAVEDDLTIRGFPLFLSWLWIYFGAKQAWYHTALITATISDSWPERFPQIPSHNCHFLPATAQNRQHNEQLSALTPCDLSALEQNYHYVCIPANPINCANAAGAGEIGVLTFPFITVDLPVYFLVFVLRSLCSQADKETLISNIRCNLVNKRRSIYMS